MKVKNCLIVCWLLVTQFWYSVHAEESAEQSLKIADDFIRAGRIQRAIGVLEKYPDKNNRSVILKLLDCMIVGAHFKEAKTLAEKSLVQGSKSYQSLLYTYIGTACKLNGDTNAALEAFSKAIDLDTNFPAIVARRKITDKMENTPDLVKTTRPKIGIAFSDNYETLETSIFIIHLQRRNGIIASEAPSVDKEMQIEVAALENTGNFVAATDFYQKSLKTGVTDVGVLNSLGLCALTEGLKRADEEWRAQQAPSSSIPYLKIADEAFKQALRIDKDNWRIWNNIAILKSEAGEESIEALQHVRDCKTAENNYRARAARALSIYDGADALKEWFKKNNRTFSAPPKHLN